MIMLRRPDRPGHLSPGRDMRHRRRKAASRLVARYGSALRWQASSPIPAMTGMVIPHAPAVNHTVDDKRNADKLQISGKQRDTTPAIQPRAKTVRYAQPNPDTFATISSDVRIQSHSYRIVILRSFRRVSEILFSKKIIRTAGPVRPNGHEADDAKRTARVKTRW